MKKRKLFEKLAREKNSHRISIVLGPRQVGKTTILKALHERISGLFLDLDVLENFEKVSSYSSLINTIKLHGYKPGQKKMFYLFLDEFQRYKDLSTIMKNVHDNHKNIKIYASGSSSLKIKDQIQESLAGRKTLHLLYPLDFEEFLWFKGDKEMVKQFSNASSLNGEDIRMPGLKNLLNEYLIYGGYPEVVLAEDGNEKIRVLRSIFDLYVKKELVGYLKFGKILGIKKLIEFIAINNGQKMKYEGAAEKCSLKQYEVKEFIEVLKETFLLNIVRPFFTNKNKELIKIPKIYFIDNGVRNFFINNFNKMKIRADSGFLFESFVMQELIKMGFDNLKFWQDKQKHEVDFIIDFISRQIPIEVKFKEKLKHEDCMGLNAFSEYYNISKGFIINLGIQKRKNSTRIILPFSLNKISAD